MFTYLEVAPRSWAAVPCWEAPAGGLGKLCQVVPASCPASGVSSSSFPPVPFGSCRSSLPVDGSTPPRRDVTQGREDVTGYIATLHKTNTCISSHLNWKLMVIPQYLTCVGFLPYCWRTRTCLPLLYERKPPDSPSADPSVQLDQEWGRWPARCSHTCTNRKDTHLLLT